MHNKHLERLLKIIYRGDNGDFLPEVRRINNIDEGKRQFQDNIKDLVLLSIALRRDKMLEVFLDYCDPNFSYNMVDTIYLFANTKKMREVLHDREPHINGRYATCLC